MAALATLDHDGRRRMSEPLLAPPDGELGAGHAGGGVGREQDRCHDRRVVRHVWLGGRRQRRHLVATARTAAVDGRFAAGAAYVFVRDPNGEWVEHKRLVPQDSRASDQFGVADVAIAGDTIVVGAPFARIGAAFQQGAVYLFERNAGGADNWGEVAKLTDDAVGAIGNIVGSVAIASNLLAVGAIRGGGDGQVTIYERDRDGAAGWSKVTTLYDGVVGDGGSFESFGSAVAISGDLLLVGAATADVSYFGQNDGAAYLFRRDQADPDRWNFVSRLTAAEAKLCPGDRTLAEIASETPEVGAEVERCAQEDSRTDLEDLRHDSGP